MKPVDDYLNELRSKLKGFDKAEGDEILEEIENHLEAGMEDGRFQSNPSKLRQEMGSPGEMAYRLYHVKNRHHWMTLLFLLFPFLFVDGAAYWLSLFEFMNGGMPGDNSVGWFVLTGVILMIIVGEILLSWRRHSVVIALWWSSFVVAQLTQPLFAAWFYRWPIDEIVTVWNVIINVTVLLPFIWLLWRARFDSLLLVFATLPLTLGLLTTSLWMDQIHMVINFRLFGIGAVVEPLLRLLMWCGVMTSYFLLRKRWMQWFGISGVILFYLFGVAVFVSTVDQRWLLFPSIIPVWVFFFVIFMVGMVLDKHLSMRRSVL